MTEKGKRVRGSAVMDAEGLFVFTPYGTREEQDRSLKLLYASGNATLWEGKEHFALRIRLRKSEKTGLSQLVQRLMHLMIALRRRQDELEREALRQAMKKGGVR